MEAPGSPSRGAHRRDQHGDTLRNLMQPDPPWSQDDRAYRRNDMEITLNERAAAYSSPKHAKSQRDQHSGHFGRSVLQQEGMGWQQDQNSYARHQEIPPAERAAVYMSPKRSASQRDMHRKEFQSIMAHENLGERPQARPEARGSGSPEPGAAGGRAVQGAAGGPGPEPHQHYRKSSPPMDLQPGRSSRHMAPPSDARTFRCFLTKKYLTLEKAWLALDQDRLGVLNYHDFVTSCRRVKFRGAVQSIFDELCDDHDEVRPDALHPSVPEKLQQLFAKTAGHGAGHDPGSPRGPCYPRTASDHPGFVGQAWTVSDKKGSATFAEVAELIHRPDPKVTNPPMDARAFRTALLKRFPSLEEAWIAMDASEDGALQFNEFVSACRRIQIVGNLKRMFEELCDGESVLRPEALEKSLPEKIAKLKGSRLVRTRAQGLDPESPSASRRRSVELSQTWSGKATTFNEALLAWASPPDKPLKPPQDVKAFRAGLAKRFKSLEHAWLEIDANRDGTLQFHEFVQACRRIEFSGNLKQIFNELTDMQDALTPEKLDPSLPAKLEELRERLETLGTGRSPSRMSRQSSFGCSTPGTSRAASRAASRQRSRPSRRQYYSPAPGTPSQRNSALDLSAEGWSPRASNPRRFARALPAPFDVGGGDGGVGLVWKPQDQQPASPMGSARPTPVASPRPHAAAATSRKGSNSAARQRFGGARRQSGQSVSPGPGGWPPAKAEARWSTYDQAEPRQGSSRSAAGGPAKLQVVRRGSTSSAASGRSRVQAGTYPVEQPVEPGELLGADVCRQPTFGGEDQAGTLAQALSLGMLPGRWSSADGHGWAIDADFKTYFNGQYLGRDFDLSEESGPGGRAIVRNDGWRVDMLQSSMTSLTWWKAGESSIRWWREAVLLSQVVGAWSTSDGLVWTVQPSGRALLNDQHVGETYDLVECITNAGQYAVRRKDGWEVDQQLSGGARLVWTKPGEVGIEWQRRGGPRTGPGPDEWQSCE